MSRTGIILIILVVLAAVSAYLYFTKAPAAADKLAQCLRDKGAIMYGASFCPHCQAQQDLFGRSFRFVPYVNCSAQSARCTKAGIKSYPTWTFPNGLRVEDTQPLLRLAEISLCPVPPTQ